MIFDIKKNGALSSGAGVTVNVTRCQVPSRAIEFVREEWSFHVKRRATPRQVKFSERHPWLTSLWWAVL